MSETDSDLVDEAAAGKRINIPPRTLAQWRYLGRGPRYYKLGSHVRYRLADLDRWAEACAVDTGKPS